jgi:hypothetical protein
VVRKVVGRESKKVFYREGKFSSFSSLLRHFQFMLLVIFSFTYLFWKYLLDTYYLLITVQNNNNIYISNYRKTHPQTGMFVCLVWFSLFFWHRASLHSSG